MQSVNSAGQHHSQNRMQWKGEGGGGGGKREVQRQEWKSDEKGD